MNAAKRAHATVRVRMNEERWRRRPADRELGLRLTRLKSFSEQPVDKQPERQRERERERESNMRGVTWPEYFRDADTHRGHRIMLCCGYTRGRRILFDFARASQVAGIYWGSSGSGLSNSRNHAVHETAAHVANVAKNIITRLLYKICINYAVYYLRHCRPAGDWQCSLLL